MGLQGSGAHTLAKRRMHMHSLFCQLAAHRQPQDFHTPFTGANYQCFGADNQRSAFAGTPRDVHAAPDAECEPA
jgi:hypothetical protein